MSGCRYCSRPAAEHCYGCGTCEPCACAPSERAPTLTTVRTLAELGVPEWVRGAGTCVRPRCACGGLVFTCPQCTRLSHHPEDARRGWCSACQAYTGDTRHQ